MPCMRKYWRGKSWQIWRTMNHSPTFIHQLFLFKKYRTVFHKSNNFEINKMAGSLKYFKWAQKKDKLDAVTLPDPDGPLSRDIPFSSIGITNTHNHQVQQEGSSKRLQGPYILLIPTQKFSVEKRAAKNSVTAMLDNYSKTFPSIA